MSGLKRSNTLQTIKRAGTGAWKWINAEDVNISYNNPQGVSYFQRSNTYKRLNSSNSVRRRPTRKQTQLNQQSYSNTNYPNSYTVNMNNGYNYPNQASSSYNYPNQTNNSYNYPNQSNNYAYNVNSQNYPNYSNSQNYPNHSNSQNQPYRSNSQNYPYHSNSYNGIRKPEPAAEKYEKETDINKSKKESRIPSVLYDPEVRKQLEELKVHKPYFMYIVTFFQIFLLLFTLYNNYVTTKHYIEPMATNPMIGPSPGTLIKMGARFVPCMKYTEYSDYEVLPCTPGIKGTINSQDRSQCSLADYCGFGMKANEKPNQWFRFIIPIFLHGGIAHIIFNLTFQIRTGLQMERDFGTWRIFIIYMASGIFGFAFEATSMQNSPSVGCSGALYGKY